jgi:hypothetical protein
MKEINVGGNPPNGEPEFRGKLNREYAPVLPCGIPTEGARRLKRIYSSD